MKISSVGLVLLTLLVITKYYVSLDNVSAKVSTLEDAFVIDYSGLNAQLNQYTHPENHSDLIAFTEPLTTSEPSLDVSNSNQQNYTYPVAKNNNQQSRPGIPEANELASNEPAPLEYSNNTLVVFNPGNPTLTNMTTQYTDPYDVAAPLDNGNTVINEMQMMMPRR